MNSVGMNHIDIIRALQQNNHQAVLVGGCVRDKIIGRTVKDYDIATSATPDKVESLFDNTLALGKSFGVIVVHGHEVATFRSDGAGRKPEVSIGVSLEEDLARRDFTMNAIAFDPISGETFDPLLGEQDIEAGIIRAVGNPEDRFSEDPLRLIRTARFSSQLSFEVEFKTLNSLFGASLEGVSSERIKEEMDKILLSDTPRLGLHILFNTGLMRQFLPEVARLILTQQRRDYHPEGDVLTHTFNTVVRAPSNLVLRWAALLHDVGKATTTDEEGKAKGHERESVKMVQDIFKRLKFSNKEAKGVEWIISNHMRIKQFDRMRISKQRLLMAHPLFLNLATFAGADREIGPDPTPGLVEHFDQSPPFPSPLLNGDDLMEITDPGPVFGRVLEHVFMQQLEGKLTDKTAALKRAEQLIKGWTNAP